MQKLIVCIRFSLYRWCAYFYFVLLLGQLDNSFIHVLLEELRSRGRIIKKKVLFLLLIKFR
jgi:hypothetical protein